MPRSLPGWRRPHPIVVDVAIVAAIVVLGIVQGPGGLPVSAASRAFTVALALPLLLRRRHPIPVFAFAVAVAGLQWLLDVRPFGDAALLVALVTVALSQPTRTTVVALAIVEVGALLAAMRWSVGEGAADVRRALGPRHRRRRHRAEPPRPACAGRLPGGAPRRLEFERDQQGRLAAAAERARIAREMHDIVAHNVSVMMALSDGASYVLRDNPEEADTAMRSASRTGRQALTEMRRLLGVLHQEGEEAELAPQPGLRLIAELVAGVRRAGLAVRYETEGETLAALPAGLQLAAYRIVQEALTNTLKHAGEQASARARVRPAASSAGPPPPDGD